MLQKTTQCNQEVHFSPIYSQKKSFKYLNFQKSTFTYETIKNLQNFVLFISKRELDHPMKIFFLIPKKNLVLFFVAFFLFPPKKKEIHFDLCEKECYM